MGMIFLYIHIPHILHILSTQSPQTNHTRRLPCSIPFSIFIAIPYIPCRFFSQRPHPLVLVFVLDALRHSRFSFVVAQWGGGFAASRSSSRRALRSGGAFRSVRRLVVSGRWATRRFCQLVLPCRCSHPVRPVRRLVGLCRLRVVRFVVPSVGSSCVSGFMPSRGSSRHASRRERLVYRLFSCRSSYPSRRIYGRHRLGCVARSSLIG